MQIICADALRASIRVLGLFAEVRPAALSVPRGLRGANLVAQLRLELDRLRGLGDLLVPVSTAAEVDARDQRLQQLWSLLPEWPDLRQAAEQFEAGQNAAADKLSMAERGNLLAVEEIALQALDARLARTFARPDVAATSAAAGQLQVAIGLVHVESASWRSLEDSWLANRLIADRGFLESFGQARKRARAFLKAQARDGRSRLKLSALQELLRWHRSVMLQLDVLAFAGELQGDLGQLQRELAELDGALDTLVLLTRLRRAAPESNKYDELLGAATDRLPGALQAGYGIGKSNYRGLIQSELA